MQPTDDFGKGQKMKAALAALVEPVTSLIERRPAVGYIGAATPTFAGLWVFIEHATKLGALVSLVIGIAVGLMTWRVQHLNKLKVAIEIENAMAERARRKREEQSGGQ